MQSLLNISDRGRYTEDDLDNDVLAAYVRSMRSMKVSNRINCPQLRMIVEGIILNLSKNRQHSKMHVNC
jgi:hypothetical protein